MTANKRVSVLEGHSARVGALAWNADVLSSGSRDRLILQRDVRTPSVMPERRLTGHRQEVCSVCVIVCSLQRGRSILAVTLAPTLQLQKYGANTHALGNPHTRLAVCASLTMF